MLRIRLPLIAAMATVSALALSGPADGSSGPGVGSAASSAPAASAASSGKTRGSATSSCTFRWKKKIVIKKVHRHGKVKRIRKVKHYRVCVPVTPPAADPARLGVRAFEYGLTLSRQTLVPGDTIIELANIGEDAHNLHITRIDTGEDVAIPETQPSGISKVRFDTSPGTYRLYCSLPEHAALGMDATIEVAAP